MFLHTKMRCSLDLWVCVCVYFGFISGSWTHNMTVYWLLLFQRGKSNSCLFCCILPSNISPVYWFSLTLTMSLNWKSSDFGYGWCVCSSCVHACACTLFQSASNQFQIFTHIIIQSDSTKLHQLTLYTTNNVIFNPLTVWIPNGNKPKSSCLHPLLIHCVRAYSPLCVHMRVQTSSLSSKYID